MHKFLFATTLAIAFVMCGCTPQKKTERTITWAELVNQLENFDSIAKLEGYRSGIITSVDPSGSNDDYNHPIRQTKDGWDVIAELDGPGYISRFWMTGASDSEHGLRIYIDGENKPRFDGRIGDWFGERAPFLPPLADYENYCWKSYVPIPFSKKIVVMVQGGGTKPGGWPRIFFQVNYALLPEGVDVESFQPDPPPAVVSALESARRTWSDPSSRLGAEIPPGNQFSAEIPAGASPVLAELKGPALLRRFHLRLEAPGATAGAYAFALRNAVLEIEYDQSGFPSVQVPVGDLFGSFWRPTGFASPYFGRKGEVFQFAFPISFKNSAVIRINNADGTVPLKAVLDAELEPLAAADSSIGYFHAAWNKTLNRDIGRPHPVLTAQGRGRFAGCILSTMSLDKSWWLLEGDESIRVDGEPRPAWLGTGLEDYFNCGWYYQHVIARPMHGLVFKAPFRTVQYRLHQPEFIGFTNSIQMLFERGPDNNSHGDIESVAFYYLDAPAKAASDLKDAGHRRAPMDPFMPQTIMTELINHERLGDAEGSIRYIDEYLSRVTGFPFEEMLRLRRVAYRERVEGIEAVRADLAEFASSTNAVVAAQAADLLWFHESPENALLVINCNVPARVYIDGKEAGQGGAMDKASIHRVQIAAGQHDLLLETRPKTQPYPVWVQAYLRTHLGDVKTVPRLPFAYGSAVSLHAAGLDNQKWDVMFGNGIGGPPSDPFVWMEPNASVFTHAIAWGIQPPEPWPQGKNLHVYRINFTLPVE